MPASNSQQHGGHAANVYSYLVWVNIWEYLCKIHMHANAIKYPLFMTRIADSKVKNKYLIEIQLQIITNHKYYQHNLLFIRIPHSLMSHLHNANSSGEGLLISPSMRHTQPRILQQWKLRHNRDDCNTHANMYLLSWRLEAKNKMMIMMIYKYVRKCI